VKALRVIWHQRLGYVMPCEVTYISALLAYWLSPPRIDDCPICLKAKLHKSQQVYLFYTPRLLSALRHFYRLRLSYNLPRLADAFVASSGLHGGRATYSCVTILVERYGCRSLRSRLNPVAHQMACHQGCRTHGRFKRSDGPLRENLIRCRSP
jgi:hypothetical protein